MKRTADNDTDEFIKKINNLELVDSSLLIMMKTLCEIWPKTNQDLLKKDEDLQ